MNHVFRAFECRVESQEHVLENPEFLMSARAGEDMLKREIRAPSIFADMDVRSSREFHARVGSYVDRPSARAPDFTRESNFDASNTFADLMGLLERGPYFLKF